MTPEYLDVPWLMNFELSSRLDQTNCRFIFSCLLT